MYLVVAALYIISATSRRIAQQRKVEEIDHLSGSAHADGLAMKHASNIEHIDLSGSEHAEDLVMERYSKIEHIDLSGIEHAEGLEMEHDFELITHDATNSSGWHVTSKDRVGINNIVKMLNPPGADAIWRWEDEQDSEWTFGLVKLTAQTAKGSLALHMIHRHGFGPLLAARAGNEFTSFMASRRQNPLHVIGQIGLTDIEFFVESQEEFRAVKTMKKLLNSLSLSGLRNLHSFDHQWSVKTWAGKVPDCSQEHAASCILQAGMSASAHALLANNGFTPSAVEEAQEASNSIFDKQLGTEPLFNLSFYGDFFTPYHTGNKNMDVKIQEENGKFFATGNVYWEDGGVSRGVKIPLTPSQRSTYQYASVGKRKALMQFWLEKHIERIIGRHKDFMRANRLKVWASEQAEFVEMYPKFADIKARDNRGRRVK